jgi:hypothetical protein
LGFVIYNGGSGGYKEEKIVINPVRRIQDSKPGLIGIFIEFIWLNPIGFIRFSIIQLI